MRSYPHSIIVRIGLLLWALSLGIPAFAEAPPPSIFTGPKTGTYYTFGQDIKHLAKQSGLEINVFDSTGSIDNIKAIQRKEGLAMGIVQSDVLGFLSRSNNQSLVKILAKLRVVFPLYQEEVHVLARKDIMEFRDLQGKKVAVGEEGSGHMLTAVNLFAIEQIVPADIRKIAPEEAVVAVLRGELDALVYVGGKPVKMFKNMEDLTNPEHRKYALLLQNVHFLPMNNAKFYEEYEPAEITHDDYTFVQTSIPTIAVQAALVSMENGAVQSSPACNVLKALTKVIKDNIATLKQSGHPKWRQVNFDAEMQGWQKSTCV